MKRHLFIIMITLCCGLCICRAQERFDWNVLGVAEGQFRPDNGRFNMFSLLSYSIDVQLWKGADLRFDGMTFAKQHKLNYISDDISTFSQIPISSMTKRSASSWDLPMACLLPFRPIMTSRTTRHLPSWQWHSGRSAICSC